MYPVDGAIATATDARHPHSKEAGAEATTRQARFIERRVSILIVPILLVVHLNRL